MCIAIVKPKGQQLSFDTAKASYESNPHGAGFAYVENGKVLIEKGFFSFEEFWDIFEPIQEENDGAMLVHFRIATSGGMDAYNCHPWRIDDDHALIHNGVISKYSFSKSHISDTGLFTNIVMRKLLSYGNNEYKEAHLIWLIEKAIGFNNKIAVLGSDGEFLLYNKNEWILDGGIWYSNHGYKSHDFFFRTRTCADIDDEFSPVPKRKKYEIRLKGGDRKLQPKEMAEFMKDYNKHTIEDMVKANLFERVFLDTEEEPNPMSADYINWWLRCSNHLSYHPYTEGYMENEGYSG